MPQNDEYAAREQSRAAAYKAAFETREAREWLASIPAPLRARAERLGLLAPALPPPSYAKEYKEAVGASNWRGNQFDENDFAAAALDAGREIDEAETQETFDENNENDYENDTDDE